MENSQLMPVSLLRLAMKRNAQVIFFLLLSKGTLVTFTRAAFFFLFFRLCSSISVFGRSLSQFSDWTWEWPQIKKTKQQTHRSFGVSCLLPNLSFHVVYVCVPMADSKKNVDRNLAGRFAVKDFTHVLWKGRVWFGPGSGAAIRDDFMQFFGSVLRCGRGFDSQAEVRST